MTNLVNFLWRWTGVFAAMLALVVLAELCLPAILAPASPLEAAFFSTLLILGLVAVVVMLSLVNRRSPHWLRAYLAVSTLFRTHSHRSPVSSWEVRHPRAIAGGLRPL